ncbi:LysR family transcriptional regulator [Celeribacter arenosi]|uniref:LysR family transcriptional regulator n=1 Tax=Celeribacter arenosi TaxID=792649 RepID=A0ABP7JYW1_9RHOB
MDLRAFDLNLLRVLDALLREGSTVKAGERIGLSQPAVSAALSRLRAALGDELFVREGQGLVATGYALSLAGELSEALGKIEGILAGPEDFDPSRATQRYVISGSDFFSELLMPALMKRLQHEAPGVVIHMVDTVFESTLEGLRSDHVDLAFLPNIDFPTWCDWEPCFWSPVINIARVGHPRLARLGIGDGDAIPLDLYCDLSHVHFAPTGVYPQDLDAALAGVGRSRHIAATLPTFNAVAQLVAGSDIIGVIPSQMARVRARAGLVTRHPQVIDIGTNELRMLWHRRMTTNPAHRWLRGVVRELLADLDEGPDGRGIVET